MSDDVTGGRPSVIIHVGPELTDDQADELKARLAEIMASPQPYQHRILSPGPRNWVLVNGWHDNVHDNGKTEAVYGPYTREQAEWLMGGPLDGSSENWTLAEMRTWPPGGPE